MVTKAAVFQTMTVSPPHRPLCRAERWGLWLLGRANYPAVVNIVVDDSTHRWQRHVAPDQERFSGF